EIATAILDGTDPDRVLGLVARHARELVGADLATPAVPAGPGDLLVGAGDGRVRQPARRAGGFGPALIAPLPVRGTVLGTLLVANAAGRRPFGAADVQLTETFAEHAGR